MKGNTNSKNPYSNPNLLINPCFQNPIDQRCGYYVAPGVNIYNDAECTNLDIVNDKPRLATFVNGNYGTVKTGTENQLTKYVKFTDMTRGYVSGSNSTYGIYGIDMWKFFYTYKYTCNLYEGNNKIVISDTETDIYNGIQQIIENVSAIRGKTVTFSVFGRILSGNCRIAIYIDDTFRGAHYEGFTTGKEEVISFKHDIPEDASKVAFAIQLFGEKPSCELYAAKLELGNKQTLVHMENGKLLLNDPEPNPGVELAKCQRYALLERPYLNYDSSAIRAGVYNANSIYFEVPTPVSMRSNPTINILDNGYINVRTVAGSQQTGFTFSAKANAGCIRIEAVKENHGLTDAQLSMAGILFSSEL